MAKPGRGGSIDQEVDRPRRAPESVAPALDLPQKRRMYSWLGQIQASRPKSGWSPRRTLTFIVAACGAAWVGILAGLWLLFRR